MLWAECTTRLSETTIPHLEKILSLATDVAGMPKTCEQRTAATLGKFAFAFSECHIQLQVKSNMHLIFKGSTS